MSQDAPQQKGLWIWPLTAMLLAITSLMALLAPNIKAAGAFGDTLSQFLVGHFGWRPSCFAMVLLLATAIRDLRPNESVKGLVRWCSASLLILSVTTLDNQIFGQAAYPLNGGTLGTFLSLQLTNAFGFLGLFLNLLVTSLAVMAWGGPSLREGLTTMALISLNKLKALTQKTANSEEGEEGEMAMAEADVATAPEEAPVVSVRQKPKRKRRQEIVEEEVDVEEEVEEERPVFKNKPFSVDDLVKENEKKKKSIQTKVSVDEPEEVVAEPVEEPVLVEKTEVPETKPEPEPVAEVKAEEPAPAEKTEEQVEVKPAAQLPLKPKRRKKKKAKRVQVSKRPGDYKLPNLDHLDDVPEEENTVDEYQKINESACALQESLRNFGLEVQVVGIQQGPVITQYELELAPGIKVSRIMNLQNDIAMALKARSVRILAPIPGKSTVGVEVPNAKRSSVGLKELIATGYKEAKEMNLPCFIGRNIFGEPVCFDISDMPHLLMAGATGAGKSVGINGLIMSLMMTRSPDEVKMILVDPKQVEMNFYVGIPYLVSPVVTDMKKVPGILDWAVRKMEERYDLLARASVRDINSFNKLGEKALFERMGVTPEEEAMVDTYMPRYVIVIDELADLMMLSSSSKEVEANIQRLAQKSRAVGIHVILATQRPSVDVITGVIKANLPCRIAYMVNSATDSRTILDRKGAESLLGRGDLLFKDPSRSDLQRLQGAFISEEEVSRVVAYWKKQGEPRYIDEIVNPNQSDEDMRQKDELYEKSARLVLESRRGSTTFLQRMLGVGYTRASRLIEMMEMDGLVGPHKGSVSRDVLYTLEEYEQRLLEEDAEDYEDDIEYEEEHAELPEEGESEAESAELDEGEDMDGNTADEEDETCLSEAPPER